MVDATLKTCYCCGTGSISYGAHKYPQWYKNHDKDNNVLCPRCNRHLYSREQEKGRRVSIDKRRVVLPQKIKRGYCSSCKNNIHDGSCKMTTIIKEYDTFKELCNSCLNKYYRRIGILKNKFAEIKKKCILCLRTTTKAYDTPRTTKYDRWFSFADGIICYTCNARIKAEKMRRRLGIKIRQFREGVRIEEQIRKLDKYISWRSTILRRDNMTCRNCGTKRRPLHVHHIKPFRLILFENEIDSIDKAIECQELWDVSNGITWCYSCHYKYGI